VTIQAQVLDMMTDLRAKKGMALIMITHDLASWEDVRFRRRHVRRQDREYGTLEDIFNHPKHPIRRACSTRCRTFGTVRQS
jgi:ABC-type dipeptide/oligopeptide/nickel transport system ATPase component